MGVFNQREQVTIMDFVLLVVLLALTVYFFSI